MSEHPRQERQDKSVSSSINDKSNDAIKPAWTSLTSRTVMRYGQHLHQRQELQGDKITTRIDDRTMMQWSLQERASTTRATTRRNQHTHQWQQQRCYWAGMSINNNKSNNAMVHGHSRWKSRREITQVNQHHHWRPDRRAWNIHPGWKGGSF